MRSCGTAGGAALRTEGAVFGVTGFHAGWSPLPSYIDLLRLYNWHVSLKGSLSHEH